MQLLFAYFIAYVDRNDNFNLLLNKNLNNPWINQLWLAILADKDALRLTYADLLVPGKNSETHNIQVNSSGFGGQQFTAMFPFSWLLKEKILELLTSFQHNETS